MEGGHLVKYLKDPIVIAESLEKMAVVDRAVRADRRFVFCDPVPDLE